MPVIKELRREAETPEFLSAKEVCRRLRISRTTLWRLQRDDATFPTPVSVSRRSVRFGWRSIEHWLEAKADRPRCS